MKIYTKEEIEELGFDLYGLQPGDETTNSFILGFNAAVSMNKQVEPEKIERPIIECHCIDEEARHDCYANCNYTTD